jgi:hypothetical protein
MSSLYRAAGILLATAAMFGIVWASHAPMTTHPSSDAVLRLGWSARPERVEQCRRPSEAEQANLPRHMRQQLICEGTTAAYRLVVRRGDAILAEQVVRGGGLRHDRRLYVFRELPLPPGEADISVRFDRIDPAADADSGSHDEDDDRNADGEGEGEGDKNEDNGDGRPHPGRQQPRRLDRDETGRSRQQREAVPPRLSFEQRLRFSPRQAILVTYDPERRALVAVPQDSPTPR